MSIKSTLDGLDPEDKRRLVHAFDNDFSQHVVLENGYYIGVNIPMSSHFEKLEEVGVWSYGTTAY